MNTVQHTGKRKGEGGERDVDLTSSANTTTTRRRGAGGCAASIARSLLRTDTDGRNKDLFLWMLQSLDFVFSLRKKNWRGLERVVVATMAFFSLTFFHLVFRNRHAIADSKQTHTQVVVKLKRFEPTVACLLADRPNASLVSGSRLLMKGGAEGGNIGHSSDGLVTAIKRAIGWANGETDFDWLLKY